MNPLKNPALLLASIFIIVSIAVMMGNLGRNTPADYFQQEAIRNGNAYLDSNGDFRWIKPEVKIVEVEKQVIVKVPEIKIVEIAIPAKVTMDDFKRAIIEDRHEQTMKSVELNEFFGEEAEPTGDPAEETVNEKVEEKKQSFFKRLFSRKKKQK